MLIRQITSLTVLIFTLLLPSVCGAIFLREGTQGRIGFNEKISLDDRVSVDFDEEYRRGGGDENYFHFELGVNYKIYPWLKLGARFREAFNKQDGPWQNEFRPQALVELKHVREHFGVINRNKLEGLIYNDAPSLSQYRNRLTLGIPISIGGATISPYAADEIFIQLNDGAGFEKNRVYAGIDMLFAKKRLGLMGMDIYYFWEDVRINPGSGTNNTIGIKFKMKFKRHRPEVPETVEMEREEGLDQTMDFQY